MGIKLSIRLAVLALQDELSDCLTHRSYGDAKSGENSCVRCVGCVGVGKFGAVLRVSPCYVSPWHARQTE